MHAYVFVYSPSKFKVGSHPLVRFEVGSTYTEDKDEGLVAITKETEGAVDPGIYVIGSDGSDLAPELTPVESRIMVDYDLFSIMDKDPWPELVGESSRDPEMRARVVAAFPELRDEHLQGFLVSLGATAA